MRVVSTALLSAILAISATTAWGQFGSYGSPEMLQLAPNAAPAQWAPSNVPANYAPMAASAYQPTVQAYPARRYGGTTPVVAPQNRGRLTPVPEPVRPLRQGTTSASPSDAGYTNYGNGGGCNGSCGSGDCGGAYCGTDCAPLCYEPVCCNWYAAAMGLYMCRNQGDRLWTSYQTSKNANQNLNSQMGLQWKGGGEIRFGRYFCCRTWALEATYWGMDAFTGFGSVSIPGETVSSTMQFDYLEFSNGDALNGYFKNSAAHRVWRYDEVHNLELNVIRQRVITACDSPWDVNWSAGLRWFRFEENFTFGAVAENQTWGDDGGIHEAYLQDDITNDMIGFQFGFESSYYLSGACRFFVAPQIGIYNNHIRNRFSLYRGDGTVAYEIEPDLDGTYPVNSSKDVLSFMTEIDFGFDWKFSRNWSARLGYRVLFISGIGLAEEQITPYAVDIPEIADIDHNATLILHGAFGGLTYNF